jgi:hypothetical protein
MWFFLVLAILLLAVAIAGARGVVPRMIGLISVGGFFFFLTCAVLLGYQARRAAIHDRDQGTASSMLVLMAGMLKDQDDATLERIAGAGGPAGEAASLLLERRRKP